MIYTENIRFLFLDDQESRHVLLSRWFSKADHCYSYDDCVAKLKDKHYDVVSLDHDLSIADQMCEPGVTNREKTGTDIARFIAQMPVKPRVAILHTFNPAGARLMNEILSRAQVTVYSVPSDSIRLSTKTWRRDKC